MPTVYKNPRGERAVRQWCSEALARADFPLTNATVDTGFGRVELTSAGIGRPQIVMVPGTGFNAAVALPWLQALSVHWATTVVDLPGQPGLSDPRRPRRDRLAWYGRALDEILAAQSIRGIGRSDEEFARGAGAGATSDELLRPSAAPRRHG